MTTPLDDLPFRPMEIGAARMLRFDESNYTTGVTHGVRLGWVDHPDGTHQPVIEVFEQHTPPERRTRFALSTLVHLALNVTEAELWEIAGRAHDKEGRPT